MFLGHTSSWENESPGHCFCRSDIWPHCSGEADPDLHFVVYAWLQRVSLGSGASLPLSFVEPAWANRLEGTVCFQTFYRSLVNTIIPSLSIFLQLLILLWPFYLVFPESSFSLQTVCLWCLRSACVLHSIVLLQSLHTPLQNSEAFGLARTTASYFRLGERLSNSIHIWSCTMVTFVASCE